MGNTKHGIQWTRWCTTSNNNNQVLAWTVWRGVTVISTRFRGFHAGWPGLLCQLPHWDQKGFKLSNHKHKQQQAEFRENRLCAMEHKKSNLNISAYYYSYTVPTWGNCFFQILWEIHCLYKISRNCCIAINGALHLKVWYLVVNKI